LQTPGYPTQARRTGLKEADFAFERLLLARLSGLFVLARRLISPGGAGQNFAKAIMLDMILYSAESV
jgi:hypothetical protein